MNINALVQLLESNSMLWTTHCLQRMFERNISRDDVKNCIKHGQIIEEYPNDYPNPSCLVFGYTLNNVVLHTVVGTDNKTLFVITAYFPSLDKFEDDFKTRRT